MAYAKPPKSKSVPLTNSSANTKGKPKSAVTDKKGDKKGEKKGKEKAKRGKNARPKRKTAEELDADMVDYWDGGNGPAAAATTTEGGANGNAQQAAAGGDDLGMGDISVSIPLNILRPTPRTTN